MRGKQTNMKQFKFEGKPYTFKKGQLIRLAYRAEDGKHHAEHQCKRIAMPCKTAKPRLGWLLGSKRKSDAQVQTLIQKGS